MKSLVFMADDEPVLALVPGDRRLDEQLLAAALGVVSIRRATLDEMRHTRRGWQPVARRRSGTPFRAWQPVH